MTIHKVQLATSASIPFEKMQKAVDKARAGRKIGLERENVELTQTTTTESNVPYYRGIFTFSYDEDISKIWSALQSRLDNTFDWYVVQYHECKADEAEPSPCVWEWTDTHGLPPKEVRP